MKKWIYALFSLWIFTPVALHAAHLGNVKIVDIRVFNTFALVMTDTNIVPAACAVGIDGVTPLKRYFTVNLDETHASNRRLSVLLAAQAQGKIFNPNCRTTCNNQFVSWLGSVTECDEVRIQ